MKKKTLLLNLFMALSVFAFVACNDDDADSLQPKMTIEGADEFGAQKLEFSNKTSDQQIKITANDDWFIRIPEEAESWLTVTPSEGKGSIEPIAINVNVAANDKTETRKATLAFVCNKIEQKALLTIEQEKLYLLTAKSNRTMINKQGGAIVISLTSNAGWTYEIDEAGQKWLTENREESTNTRLALIASELDEEVRTATITFTSEKQADLTAVVNLTQKDLELYANKNIAYFTPNGGEVILDVKTTNVDEWNVEVDNANPWITAEKVGDQIKITTTAFGTSRREGIVNLTTPVDDSMIYPITIIQRANPTGPVADILDVVFNEDGTAKDVSASNNTVKYVAGDPSTISYNDVYLRYAPTFTHNQAGSGITSGFYRIDYTDAMMSALDDGYTMEALIKVNKAPNGSEIKAFSATTSGGMAIMIGSNSRPYSSGVNSPTSTKKAIEFTQHNGSKWCFATTDVVPEVGVYYHVVGVYDANAGKTYCYINGELKATCDCTGLKHMTTAATRVRAFTIGGNTSSNTAINGAWNGEVAIARIYDDVLTADQIKALYEDIK